MPVSARSPASASIRQVCNDVRQAVSLAAIVSRNVKLTRCGSEWKGCCPFHRDRTPSFTIYEGDRRFKCFGCGAQGDVFDFIMRMEQIGLRASLEAVGRNAVETMPLPAWERRTGRDRSQEAHQIWTCTAPAVDSLAETYLRARGFQGTVPADLRFAELRLGRRSAMPALVAAVRALSGEVQGIQRTYLSPPGTSKADLPAGKAKFSLGRVREGAIRLTSPAPELIVSEGLEDGLTLLQGTGAAVWVAAGASMLPAMKLPQLVRTVVIGADNDVAGRAAAAKAAEAFTRQGRKVRIMRPAEPYKDFNAQLLAHEHDR